MTCPVKRYYSSHLQNSYKNRSKPWDFLLFSAGGERGEFPQFLSQVRLISALLCSRWAAWQAWGGAEPEAAARPSQGAPGRPLAYHGSHTARPKFQTLWAGPGPCSGPAPSHSESPWWQHRQTPSARRPNSDAPATCPWAGRDPWPPQRLKERLTLSVCEENESTNTRGLCPKRIQRSPVTLFQ